MARELTIGQLSKLTGVPTKTIRYYEEVGILPAPQRSESGYRLYTETDARRLELIRRARLLDMALPQVQALVQWASGSPCDDFQGRFLDVVRRKLGEVEERIADLLTLKQDLQHLEAHLMEVEKEVSPDHTMLECSPETCTCLGAAPKNKTHSQEVMLWPLKSR